MHLFGPAREHAGPTPRVCHRLVLSASGGLWIRAAARPPRQCVRNHNRVGTLVFREKSDAYCARYRRLVCVAEVRAAHRPTRHAAIASVSVRRNSAPGAVLWPDGQHPARRRACSVCSSVRSLSRITYISVPSQVSQVRQTPRTPCEMDDAARIPTPLPVAGLGPCQKQPAKTRPEFSSSEGSSCDLCEIGRCRSLGSLHKGRCSTHELQT